MDGNSSRQVLLRAGLSQMRRHGYNATGVQAIIEQAKLPKGSFYHHFGSKERFGEEVVAAYFEDHLNRVLRRFLDDEALTPRQRLLSYFAHVTTLLKKDGFVCGCLIGNLTLEAADTSKRIQQRVSMIFAAWRQAFAGCIAEAQAVGEIGTTVAAHELAEFLLSAWEGAMLRAKADKTSVPLDLFQRFAAERILSP
jgi:TetR/AcrR family transcriptional regulator, transcriptional repressor for nem operon